MPLPSYLHAQEDHVKDVENAALTLRNLLGSRIYKLERTKNKLKVLLGTSSFWEGIDVRGEALSCVIIDKLPFGSPGDPVAAARIEHINRNGGNAFRDYQLPQAVLALRQGAGRLIRDPKDTGLLVVADPRLLTKSYGKLFVNSLPNMTRTRKLDVVKRFFDYLARQGQETEQAQS